MTHYHSPHANFVQFRSFLDVTQDYSCELGRLFGYLVNILVRFSRLYQNGPGRLVRSYPPWPSNLGYHPHRRMTISSSISNAFYDASVFTWDVFLTLGNLVRSSRPVGEVTPLGHPGYGGYWPEYRPPQEGDSRCCCPAFNAMANHGMSAPTRYSVWLTTHRVFSASRI